MAQSDFISSGRRMIKFWSYSSLVIGRDGSNARWYL